MCTKTLEMLPKMCKLYQKGICPNAEKFYEEVMSIPLYYSLTDEDVEDVIRAVKKVTAYYRR